MLDAFLGPDVVRVLSELFDKVLTLIIEFNAAEVERCGPVTRRLRETAATFRNSRLDHPRTIRIGRLRYFLTRNFNFNFDDLRFTCAQKLTYS